MFTATRIAATVFACLCASAAAAQDSPQWDPVVERVLIEKLQPRLPQMRPAYGLREGVALRPVSLPLTGIGQLATIDTGHKPRKYPGRITWM